MRPPASAGIARNSATSRRPTSPSNFGGGAKIKLVGPLRVRLDYRVFKLQGSPLYETYHRFYAGANLSF